MHTGRTWRSSVAANLPMPTRKARLDAPETTLPFEQVLDLASIKWIGIIIGYSNIRGPIHS